MGEDLERTEYFSLKINCYFWKDSRSDFLWLYFVLSVASVAWVFDNPKSTAQWNSITCTKTKSFKRKSYFCTNSGLCAWNNRLMLVHRRISIHFMWVLSAVKAAVCPSPQKYCYAFKMSKASFLVPAKGALRHQTSQQPPDSTAVSLCRFYRSWIS